VRRISVVGNSGAGKTTLGRALAGRLGVPFVELDSLYHLEDWRPVAVDDFRAQVGALVGQDGWVVDGNYSAVRDLVWDRADTVVWFDLPRRTVMRQVIARTLRRCLTRAELWNGNRESFGSVLNPRDSIFVWSWTRHAVYRQRYSSAAGDPHFAHLRFVRIASRADAAALLADLAV
jgi:adenylate kinase family enzyme